MAESFAIIALLLTIDVISNCHYFISSIGSNEDCRHFILYTSNNCPPHKGETMREDSKPIRTYERTWEEIEEMLEKAQDRIIQWREWFEQCESDGDRNGMKEAARNYKALEGVVKTLKWTLGEQGVGHPLS